MNSVTIGLVPRERFSVAAECLERLLSSRPRGVGVVVVDPAMPDRYRVAAQRVARGHAGVEWVRVDDLLPNAARNVVLEHCRTEWLGLVENDVLVGDGWLDALLRACEEEEAEVAAPLILERFGPYEKVHYDDRLHAIVEVRSPEGVSLRIDPRPDSKEGDRGGTRRRPDFLETHCMLFRRAVFDRIGPFDASLTAQEELDLSLSLHAHGVPIVFEPRSVVTFLPPPPVYPDEREHYLRKWDPTTYADDLRRVTARWKLLNPPSAVGVVQSRRDLTLDADPDRQVAKELAFRRLVENTATEVRSVAPETGGMILVHDDQLDLGLVARGLDVRPFLERDGVYWGPPTDDTTAITELDRMRSEGARVIAFTWPAFWWLDHYREFADHLSKNFPLLMRTERLVAFGLDATPSSVGVRT